MSQVNIYEKNSLIEILEKSYDHPVMMVFTAEWLSTSGIVNIVLDKVANFVNERMSVFKVDAEIHEDLSKNYRIASLPTTLIFYQGEIVDKTAGILSKKQLIQKMESVYATLSR